MRKMKNLFSVIGLLLVTSLLVVACVAPAAPTGAGEAQAQDGAILEILGAEAQHQQQDTGGEPGGAQQAKPQQHRL